MLKRAVTLLLFFGVAQARAGDMDPRVTKLNDRLLGFRLERFHQIELWSHALGSVKEQPANPLTNSMMPFRAGKARAQSRAIMTIEPLGLKSTFKNISFSMGLKISSSRDEQSEAKTSPKNKVLEDELDGLIQDPTISISVTMGIEFDQNWLKHGDRLRGFGGAPNTSAQLMHMIRAETALARVQRDMGNANIKLEASTIISGHVAGSGSGESLGLSPSIVLKLNVPAGVSPLQTYVAFYKYLFEGLVNPIPLQLMPPSAHEKPSSLVASIKNLFASTPDVCAMELQADSPAPSQLEGPAGKELVSTANRDVLLGRNLTIVTIKTPLGPVDILVTAVK